MSFYFRLVSFRRNSGIMSLNNFRFMEVRTIWFRTTIMFCLEYTGNFIFGSFYFLRIDFGLAMLKLAFGISAAGRSIFETAERQRFGS